MRIVPIAFSKSRPPFLTDKTTLSYAGDTPLAWASWHLRPAAILQLLCHGDHRISPAHVARYTTDHGSGWGGLEMNLRGTPHTSK